jgi:hypothetical protein
MGSYVYDTKTYHEAGLYIGDSSLMVGYDMPLTAGNPGQVLACNGPNNPSTWINLTGSELPISNWPGSFMQNNGGNWMASSNTQKSVVVPSGSGQIAAFSALVNTTNSGMGRFNFAVLVRKEDGSYDFVIEDGTYTCEGGVLFYHSDFVTKANNSSLPSLTVSNNSFVQFIPQDPVFSKRATVTCSVVPHAPNAVSFV